MKNELSMWVSGMKIEGKKEEIKDKIRELKRLGKI